tara:strand:- start:50 stop:499 length:450 start_codon:yes stop_codon:yes gene_type:complete
VGEEDGEYATEEACEISCCVMFYYKGTWSNYDAISDVPEEALSTVFNHLIDNNFGCMMNEIRLSNIVYYGMNYISTQSEFGSIPWAMMCGEYNFNLFKQNWEQCTGLQLDTIVANTPSITLSLYSNIDYGFSLDLIIEDLTESNHDTFW